MLRAGAYRRRIEKPHTCWQHHAALTGGMTYSEPAQLATSRLPIRGSDVAGRPAGGHRGDRTLARPWPAPEQQPAPAPAGPCRPPTGGTASSTGGEQHRDRRQATTSQLAQGGEVRRVHAQQRGQRLPGPGRVGRATMIRATARDRHEHPGVPEALSACKDLEPPGFTSAASGAAQQQAAALKFAQCIRENGVPDFPDPDPGSSPSSTRIESHPPQRRRAG